MVFSIVLIGLSAVNATDPATTNNTTLNSTNGTALHNTSKVTKQSTSVMKGYWMFSQDVNSANATKLKSKGITDVFVLTRGVTGVYHYKELQAAIKKFHPYGIKVHAWIVCFKDDNHFVNPSGCYSYTVKVYVKTTKYLSTKKIAYKVKTKKWYKSWYKSWHKYCGKWRYTWSYTWKYTWKYATKYKYKKAWKYKPVYRYEKRTGHNLTYNNQLISEIASIARKYNIDGIHLDYVRYSGTAKYGNAAYQQPGGVDAAVNAVTAFVRSVSSKINSTNNLDITGKPHIKLSAAVMPEGVKNTYYYGQDYGKLTNYLDFLVPMTYHGNYNANNAWITKQIQYIVSEVKGKPVYAGLTTYCSDSNLKSVSLDALQNDVNSAKIGGAAGFVLFRYNFGCSYVPT